MNDTAIRNNGARGVKNHIKFSSGRMKTVCTTAVLAHFGIDAKNFHYSDSHGDVKRHLNAHGWRHSSRLSAVGVRGTTPFTKYPSVGKVRQLIAKLDDGPGAMYYVGVKGHAMLLDNKGQTVVDTAPRRVDRRKIVHISVVRPGPAILRQMTRELNEQTARRREARLKMQASLRAFIDAKGQPCDNAPACGCCSAPKGGQS
jgi:hypothetical protein